jgi:hypothetical protein
MRSIAIVVLVLGLPACGGASAGGRLPTHLVATTGVAVPGRPLMLRSVDGTSFSRTAVEVPMERVPGPVRALRSASCPSREGNVRFSEDEVDGSTAFTVYTGEGPRACAVTARPSGVRLWVDEAVDPQSMPPAVARTVDGVFHGDYEVEDAVKRSTDGQGDSYELTVRKGGREYIIVLGPGGALLQRLRRYPGVLDVPDR